jgi:radical SAM superfamily enzyme YgiQ (UPF0313 family)
VRILLIQPDFNSGAVGFRLAAMPEPLGLEILAATVPDHDVMILDMRLEDDLVGTLERFAPDVVAVTALTTEVYSARKIMAAVKRHAAEPVTVVGGHHATLIPEDFYRPYVDVICLGEGELVFPQLIEVLARGRPLREVLNAIWRDPDGSFIHNGWSCERLDVDAVPLPRRDLVAKYRPEYYFLFDRPDTSAATGRGCPFRCAFCSVWEFYRGRACQMSPERVIRELRTVDTAHITFVDDNFMMNARRESAIAERIKSEGIAHRYSMECRADSIVRHSGIVEKWADAGLYAVLMGLEGASDKMLQNVNKRTSVRLNEEAIHILQANGVIIWGAFLVDVDWTAEDFEALGDYVTRNQITYTQFTVLTPLPGTQLYREKQAELLTRDYTCYDTLHAVLPTRLDREEFYRRFADLYWQRNLAPMYDLVRERKIRVEDVRRGHEMLKAMSRWESYTENDPVLGRRAGLTVGPA